MRKWEMGSGGQKKAAFIQPSRSLPRHSILHSPPHSKVRPAGWPLPCKRLGSSEAAGKSVSELPVPGEGVVLRAGVGDAHLVSCLGLLRIPGGKRERHILKGDLAVCDANVRALSPGHLALDVDEVVDGVDLVHEKPLLGARLASHAPGHFLPLENLSGILALAGGPDRSVGFRRSVRRGPSLHAVPLHASREALPLGCSLNIHELTHHEVVRVDRRAGG
mmetsp:Transcript_12090/g.25746  ORF Transcript_12090/g.25746 Transcript_12090/m.25746 type:complete len:220 (-) Transcript_12090:653-1312(-)